MSDIRQILEDMARDESVSIQWQRATVAFYSRETDWRDCTEEDASLSVFYGIGTRAVVVLDIKPPAFNNKKDSAHD